MSLKFNFPDIARQDQSLKKMSRSYSQNQLSKHYSYNQDIKDKLERNHEIGLPRRSTPPRHGHPRRS